MILWTDYLALVLMTLAVLLVSILHYRNPHRTEKAQALGTLLVQILQVLVVLSWILLLLVEG